MRVEPVSSATKAPALDYLGREPILNVFISGVLLHDFANARERAAVALSQRGVCGVIYCGRQVVIAAEPEAIAPLARYARRHRGERMIVGNRTTVSAYWNLVERGHAPARLVRERQLVMALDRNQLKPYERNVIVRHAKSGEWKTIADGSAEMIRHEIDYDPRLGSYDFAASVRDMIERKLWWVGVADARLCFFCNAGPWSDRTIQLQGIWTPPELRGRGLATASLAAICDRLLEITPTLSLYVNDFNHAAIALYRRVGFEHVGDFQSILF